MVKIELLIAEDDSSAVVFLENDNVRDTLVETNWELAESDSEVAMVTVDSVKVGWESDVIFFAENDVLIIDSVDVNDVKAFCSDEDALKLPLL